jgi:hypothetical protein
MEEKHLSKLTNMKAEEAAVTVLPASSLYYTVAASSAFTLVT